MFDISFVAFHYLLSQMPGLLCSQPQTRGNPTASSSLDLPPVPACSNTLGALGSLLTLLLGSFLKSAPTKPTRADWVAWTLHKTLLACSAPPCQHQDAPMLPSPFLPTGLFLCTTTETLVSVHTYFTLLKFTFVAC